jgi:malonate transporter and related proteins
MNISGLVGTLVPVFFVIALAYLAGKRNAFDTGQVAGLSKLVTSYALPASFFVGMTTIRRDLLLQQGRLFLALILAHVGLFVVAWIVLRKIKSLSGTRSIIYSLILATSGTPLLGLAILEPILGATSAGAVGLVALAIFLTIPVAIVFLEIDAAAKNRQTRTDRSKPSPVVIGLKGGLKSPLLWGPVFGIAVVLARVHLPPVIVSCLKLIGSATSGVAVFTVGLVLAAYPVRFSLGVFAGSLARVTVQSAMLGVLLHLLSVESPFSREALVYCSFPVGPTVALFADRYHAARADTAAMLLLSTLGLAFTVPAMLWLTR